MGMVGLVRRRMIRAVIGMRFEVVVMLSMIVAMTTWMRSV